MLDFLLLRKLSKRLECLRNQLITHSNSLVFYDYFDKIVILLPLEIRKDSDLPLILVFCCIVQQIKQNLLKSPFVKHNLVVAFPFNKVDMQLVLFDGLANHEHYLFDCIRDWTFSVYRNKSILFNDALIKKVLRMV